MPSRLVAHLVLLLAMFIWSLSFIALKIGLTGFTPTELMAGRMTVAALCFLPLWPRLWRTVRQRGHWKPLALMVCSEPCLYFLCETYALRNTSASQAGMIVAVLPVCVGAAAWLFLGEKTSLRTWCGFLLAFCGVAWLSLGAVATENAPNPLLGNLLEALAMACATVYTVSLKRLSTVYTPMQLTAFQALAGMSFFVPLGLLTGGAPSPGLGLELPLWAPWAAVVFLGCVVTFGGYGLYNYGVSRLPAGQASAYTNLIPVMTLFFGVFLLGEVFLPSQYAASCLVILGVVLSQRR